MSVPDFSDCAQDALHFIGEIQPLGALVAVAVDDGRVTACSANVGPLLGRSPEALLAAPAAEIFGDRWPFLASLAQDSGRCRIGDLPRDDGGSLTVVGHRRDAHYLLEFEPELSAPPSWWDEPARIRYIERLTRTTDRAGIARLLADTVAGATGYDRVMIYRFLDGWDGEVIEQRCRSGVEGFLGLRFPAGDIPANARALYTLNWQRIIADTEAANVPVRAADGDEAPLDLSFSILRAVHPVHVQYLRNMGVRGSLSLSLVVDGTLWGMVTCHHLAPKALNAHERLALEEMARLASLHLSNLLHLEAETRLSALRERLAVIDQALDPSADDPARALAAQLGRVRDLLDADGLWFTVDGVTFRRGGLPDPEELAALDRWLAVRADEGYAHVDTVPAELRHHESLVKHAAAALRLDLGEDAYLLAVREEVVQEVAWAGHQDCGDGDGAPRQVLSPRQSFAAWRDKVRFQGRPWKPPVLEIAASLRLHLIDYLRAARDKERAYSDPLTGLANRYAFDEGIAAGVAACRSEEHCFALHLVDLDRFKPVNDTYGHAAGDNVLRTLADRLLGLARREDLVARLGGDEFAVLQRDITGAEDAVALAERIVAAMARPVTLPRGEVTVGASVGVAVFPDDAATAELLRERADTALYAVKGGGRGTYSRYDDG
ncbi:diguanylate cyclase [Salinisphaera sp. PC39]|uniref:sensor domain-containing diguanylate cyclase n=1 Tax=Salinisphaera sp. PC39 TaxID=1304156 RepID=UPI00333F8C4C